MHDWGAVGLAFAQRLPERVERLVVINAVPFLPGYRWHRTARIWRTPVLGELAMGTHHRFTLRRALARGQRHAGPAARARGIDSVLAHFDQGTQRAILRLYRELAAGGARGGRRAPRELTMPALVVWGARDPYIPARFGASTRALLGTPSSSSSPTPATGHGSTGRT